DRARALRGVEGRLAPPLLRGGLAAPRKKAGRLPKKASITETPPMKHLPAALALLALASCGYIVHLGNSNGFGEIDGVLTFNGTKLPFHRWVPLTGVAEPADLHLSTGTGEITLSGGSAAQLEVELFSEVDDDGSVALQAGKPVATSASG